jgi:hypothetical protein
MVSHRVPHRSGTCDSPAVVIPLPQAAIERRSPRLHRRGSPSHRWRPGQQVAWNSPPTASVSVNSLYSLTAWRVSATCTAMDRAASARPPRPPPSGDSPLLVAAPPPRRQTAGEFVPLGATPGHLEPHRVVAREPNCRAMWSTAAPGTSPTCRGNRPSISKNFSINAQLNRHRPCKCDSNS